MFIKISLFCTVQNVNVCFFDKKKRETKVVQCPVDRTPRYIMEQAGSHFPAAGIPTPIPMTPSVGSAVRSSHRQKAPKSGGATFNAPSTSWDTIGGGGGPQPRIHRMGFLPNGFAVLGAKPQTCQTQSHVYILYLMARIGDVPDRSGPQNLSQRKQRERAIMNKKKQASWLSSYINSNQLRPHCFVLFFPVFPAFKWHDEKKLINLTMILTRRFENRTTTSPVEKSICWSENNFIRPSF